MLPIDPIETVDIISESGELDTIRVYNTLIRASMKNNQFSQVLQLIAHLRKHGVQPNVVTYGMLLDTLSKAGKLEQAKKMFHDIIEKGMIKPDLYIFSTMIDACGRNGDIKHMFYLKDQMAAYDLYPEEIIYNSILSAMSRQKRVDLRRVMAVVDELVKSEPPIYPTIRTFNPVVAAFASKARASGLGSDELQFLQTWYAKISDEYYVVKDSYMYGLAIEAFAASNRLDDAMDVYGEMMRHSETDVSVTRVFTSPSSRHIDMLTRLSIEQLRFDNALRLWRDWNALGAYVTESVAGIVLYACDQGGLFGIAHDIVVSLLTPPGSSSAGSKEAGSTSTSTSSNSDHVTRFNPKAVSEKTLMLYIGIAVKHNKLETIVPIMDLWRTSILASSEPASAEAASLAGIRTQLADIRSHRVLSEETVKNIVRLLSRSKDKDAANDVTGQVLVFVDKYFPEAVPV
ncbi:hypothetical protein LPJ75_004293 [Coemansia sp. RSA 2598]|nr:hypothetical protein LPJ75_004293 [Coemansia sp. RSA 2598]